MIIFDMRHVDDKRGKIPITQLTNFSKSHEQLFITYHISEVVIFKFDIVSQYHDCANFRIDYFFFDLIFGCSIAACAAATSAIGILCGDALT